MLWGHWTVDRRILLTLTLMHLLLLVRLLVVTGAHAWTHLTTSPECGLDAEYMQDAGCTCCTDVL